MQAKGREWVGQRLVGRPMSLDLYVCIARHAGLREPERLLDALAAVEGQPDEIVETLRRHHLTSASQLAGQLRFTRDECPAG